MRFIIGILLVLLLLLQYRLWVGEGSLAEVSNLQREIAAQQQELAKLHQRNRALQAEVQDLKQGLEAIEERARSELGMIKEGETFYQVIEPEQAVTSD
ncbi:cell division protein FtsB [Pseudomonadota bacterium]